MCASVCVSPCSVVNEGLRPALASLQVFYKCPPYAIHPAALVAFGVSPEQYRRNFYRLPRNKGMRADNWAVFVEHILRCNPYGLVSMRDFQSLYGNTTVAPLAQQPDTNTTVAPLVQQPDTITTVAPLVHQPDTNTTVAPLAQQPDASQQDTSIAVTTATPTKAALQTTMMSTTAMPPTSSPKVNI